MNRSKPTWCFTLLRGRRSGSLVVVGKHGETSGHLWKPTTMYQALPGRNSPESLVLVPNPSPPLVPSQTLIVTPSQILILVLKLSPVLVPSQTLVPVPSPSPTLVPSKVIVFVPSLK